MHYHSDVYSQLLPQHLPQIVVATCVVEKPTSLLSILRSCGHSCPGCDRQSSTTTRIGWPTEPGSTRRMRSIPTKTEHVCHVVIQYGVPTMQNTSGLPAMALHEKAMKNITGKRPEKEHTGKTVKTPQRVQLPSNPIVVLYYNTP